MFDKPASGAVKHILGKEIVALHRSLENNGVSRGDIGGTVTTPVPAMTMIDLALPDLPGLWGQLLAAEWYSLAFHIALAGLAGAAFL